MARVPLRRMFGPFLAFALRAPLQDERWRQKVLVGGLLSLLPNLALLLAVFMALGKVSRMLAPVAVVFLRVSNSRFMGIRLSCLCRRVERSGIPPPSRVERLAELRWRGDPTGSDLPGISVPGRPGGACRDGHFRPVSSGRGSNPAECGDVAGDRRRHDALRAAAHRFRPICGRAQDMGFVRSGRDPVGRGASVQGRAVYAGVSGILPLFRAVCSS